MKTYIGNSVHAEIVCGALHLTVEGLSAKKPISERIILQGWHVEKLLDYIHAATPKDGEHLNDDGVPIDDTKWLR